MASARNQQEELRRLMREKMAGRSSAAIPSTSALQQSSPNGNHDSTKNNPFVKVTSSGRVVCTICPGVHIKSWKTHQLSAEHKRHIRAQRAGLTAAASLPPKPVYRPTEIKPVLLKEPPRSILKNPLVKVESSQEQELLEYEADEPHEEVMVVSYSHGSIRQSALNSTSVSNTARGLGNSALKRRAVSDSAEKSKGDKPDEAVMQDKSAGGAVSSLPEGFFDDPRLDAKARNQEYRDPQDIEWDRYQKALREEENKSEQVCSVLLRISFVLYYVIVACGLRISGLIGDLFKRPRKFKVQHEVNIILVLF